MSNNKLVSIVNQVLFAFCNYLYAYVYIDSDAYKIAQHLFPLNTPLTKYCNPLKPEWRTF